MGFLTPGEQPRNERQETPKAPKTGTATQKAGKSETPAWDNWEGRRKGGFSEGGYGLSGVPPFGARNRADDVKDGIAAAGHTPDRAKARGRGAATRG